MPKLCSKNSEMRSHSGEIVQLTVNRYRVICTEFLSAYCDRLCRDVVGR